MTSAKERFAAFVAGLSPADRSSWETLTPSRRGDAETRFEIFEGWESGELEAEEAIRRFGRSPSRFYRLAAQWRQRPNLAALGVGGSAPRRRAKLDPDVVNRLQSRVAEVVRLNADASVSRQAAILLEVAGYADERPIGMPALRRIVEAERWRIDAVRRVGHQILLDCSAINFARPDGRPHILFLIADAGTGLALGFSLGREADVRLGYAAAAAEALGWIERNDAVLPWAAALTQTVVVAGNDDDAAIGLVNWMVSEGIGGNVLRASSTRRFGSQFRKLYGERLGRVQITPARTLQGDALPDNGNMAPWSEEQVRDELSRTFAAHNKIVIDGFSETGEALPPSTLVSFLDRVAGLG
ncbi:hypothetical protein [Qipengyuania sediminis]|uniref:hypothetical protein n=1 Tax=Qipengyuania sediminis TaxID=1532023 RepID=UPI00105A7A8B|nr:hypothetical protein [Qipengyuania sediminis]